MNREKRLIRHLRGLIIFTIVLIVLCFQIDKVTYGIKFAFGLISPFILGAAMAFVLNVLMRFLETKVFEHKKLQQYKIIQKVKRPVSLLITILLILGIVLVAIFILIPEMIDAGAKIANDIQAVIPVYQKKISNLVESYPKVKEYLDPFLLANPDWEEIINRATEFVMVGGKNLATSTVNTITQVASKIFSGASMFVVAFVFAIYILSQKEKFSNQSKNLVNAFLPEKVVKRVLEITSLCYKTFSNFITGQCIEACILGSIFFVVLSIARFPYALPIAFIIGMFALIPIFGSFVGCFVGTFLILTESPLKALVFIALFLVIQQIEGNLIYPKVVGNSIGLPAIWVLVAVVVGGSLYGIIGILISIPLLSVIYALIQKEVRHRLNLKEKAVKEKVVNEKAAKEKVANEKQ